MCPAAKTISRDYRDFRFRLRHDLILRQRLKRVRQQAIVDLARDMGFEITLDDLNRSKKKAT